MDDSSLFQRRLSASLLSMDPAWRSSFIDYEKLRKQVKKIVFVQQQEALSAHTPNPDPQNAPLLTARTSKYHQHFHSTLHAECASMNAFFLGRASACTKLFEELGLDHAAIAHQQVHPVATLTFSKVLVDTFPTNAARVLSPQLSHQAASTAMHALEPRQIALFKRFLHLCYEIDQLRKYVLINHLVLWKVVKKYDKHAGQDTQKQFTALLQQFDFSGEKTSELVQRAQFVSKRLMQAEEDERKGTCPICLRAPMVDPLALSCCHSFCFTCMLHQPTFGVSCPICRREDEWDAHLLGIEGVMSDSVTQCISSPREHASPSLSQPHPLTPLTPTLSPNTVVAKALQMHGVNSAMRNLPPYVQDALLNAVSSAAVAAVSAINRGGGGSVPKADSHNVIQAAVNAAIQAQMGQWTALGSPQELSPMGRGGMHDFPFAQSPSSASLAGLSPVSTPMSLDELGGGLSTAAVLQQLMKKARSVKQSAGVSCHQCKTTKMTHELHFCTSHMLVSKKGRRRKCRKKYCETSDHCQPHLSTSPATPSSSPTLTSSPCCPCLLSRVRRCLRRSYTPSVMESAVSNPKEWPCPSCLQLCICAACHRQDGGESEEEEGESVDTQSVGSSGTRKSASVTGGSSVANGGVKLEAPATPVQPLPPQIHQQHAHRKRKELSEAQSALMQLTPASPIPLPPPRRTTLRPSRPSMPTPTSPTPFTPTPLTPPA